MKMNDTRRYAAVMLAGAVLNLGFYWLAHIFKLPMWTDTVGTAYAALMLEPAAGVVVAFLTNFFQSVFIYGTDSLVYYFVGAAAALSFGVALRKKGKICWKRLPLACICYVFFGTAISWALTLWRTAGIPDSGWELYFFNVATGVGAHPFAASFFGIAVLKVADSLVIALLLPMLYMLTPKKAVTKTLQDPLSWKNPIGIKKRAQ